MSRMQAAAVSGGAYACMTPIGSVASPGVDEWATARRDSGGVFGGLRSAVMSEAVSLAAALGNDAGKLIIFVVVLLLLAGEITPMYRQSIKRETCTT
ncbi:hypothetical protein FQR65_LT06769 [Abscondita terminalis]|nr:hypothetical protein FQR65_LT06769 [Abscondita terminalis]